MRHSPVLSLTAVLLRKVPVVWQRTATKCTKIYNARAQPLFSSLNLVFGDVPVAVAVVVCLVHYKGPYACTTATARTMSSKKFVYILL